MEQVYSVTQVNNYIKNMFVKDYVLNRIYMKGEVSNCKYHSSGHIYFTLKDETGQMACVMFAGYRTGLPFRLEEGQSVIVLGGISVYERDGKYQMYAKEIKLDGLGLLYERFELLKRKLSEEGLFDTSHKKPLVPFPKTVGIVTASTGAAIQDIINISSRRNPYVQLILYPAKVQGDGAAKTIVAGIKTLEAKGVDTIIVGRGGGSIEDLWAFNEEIVARAIFDCSVPIISAVGHETDVTIADFVSDLRAPTPSAAAELAIPEIDVLISTLVDYHASFVQAVMRKITLSRAVLEQKRLQLTHLSPVYTLRQKRQYTIDLENKLRQRMKDLIRHKRHLLDIQIERLKAASPLDKLKSGFSYVSDESGKVVNSITKTRPSAELTIAVTDGLIKAKTIGVESIDR